MAIKFLNNLETSTGSLTITKATTDPLLYLYNTTNGSGATIRFSDQSGGSQTGDITFYHSDGSSQGGGASWHFASQPDTVLVVGSSINNGRFVSKSAGSAGEVDYGFYDDVNTGMYRSSANNASLVAGGVRGVDVSTTAVSLRHAGSVKLATTSAGIYVTGEGYSTAGWGVGTGETPVGKIFNSSGVFSVRAETARQIAFGNVTNGEAIRIDTVGNVGIGTTSPDSKLEVLGVTDLGVSGYQIRTSNSVGNNSAIIHRKDSGGNLEFRAANDDYNQLFIQSGGNIGIGTSNPTFQLHVNSIDASDSVAYIHHNNAAQSSGDVLKVRSDAGDNAGSALLNVANNTGSALYVRGDRNVGIGTTSPGAKLDVAGTGNFTGLVSGITPVAAANFVTKAYADAGNARVTPATPSTITSTIVGETIEIAFNQSSTSNIDYYQVWSSDDGGDYGIIAQITPADFSSTMTVVDTTFVTGGTMSYRVFAVRGGIYSTAGTTSKAYTVSALSVTDMTVVNLNTAYYIQYEKPTSRFIDHVEIYMDSQTTSAALSRSNATIVYSGQNASYMRNVNTSSNFHQFWVEIVTS